MIVSSCQVEHLLFTSAGHSRETDGRKKIAPMLSDAKTEFKKAQDSWKISKKIRQNLTSRKPQGGDHSGENMKCKLKGK